MNKLVSVLLAASTLAVAAPAALAQPSPGTTGYERSHGQHSIREDLRQIERRIERGRANGTLTRREAERLTARVWDIRRLERRYRSRDGYLNRWERRDLETRVQRLRMELRWERRDDDHGYRDRDRDGRPDRYEDDRGTWPDSTDRDRDGRPDRYEDDRGTRPDAG